MKSMNLEKRLFILFLFLCIQIDLSGCDIKYSRPSEIDDLYFVRVVGIDKVENQNDVRVTISVKAPKTSGSADSKGENYTVKIFSAEGNTIFEAMRNLDTFIEKKPFWGDTDFILIGEETARDDILKYFDVFARESQFRLTVKTIVVYDGTAEDFIKNTESGDVYISDKLRSIVNETRNTSLSMDVSLAKFFVSASSKTCCSYLPALSYGKSYNSKHTAKDKDYFALDKIAIFKKSKLIGYIDGDNAKGFNWINHQFKSGIIIVKDKKGSPVSLEVYQADSKIEPEFSVKGLSVKITIKMSSNIGEEESAEYIFDEKTLSFLIKQQNEIIKSQVNGAIEYARQNKADIFGIRDRIFHKYPGRWEAITTDWENAFSKLAFNVSVNSKINRSYEIKESVKGIEGCK